MARIPDDTQNEIDRGTRKLRDDPRTLPTPVQQARQRLIDHAQTVTLEHMRAIESGSDCCARFVHDLEISIAEQSDRCR